MIEGLAVTTAQNFFTCLAAITLLGFFVRIAR